MSMINKYLLKKEISYLREELITLKNCQVTFVTVAITGTGLLLGLAARFSSDSLPGVFYLFPLVIVLPAWWIFFEKAKTITRIVGYLRIIERLILKKTEADFLGWENAQAEYRNKELKELGNNKKNSFRDLIKNSFNVMRNKDFRRQVKDLGLLRASPYWMLVY